MKPATDLCSTCQGFTDSLSKTGNLQEEEKELMLQKYGDHIQKAKKQRDYYRDQCQESKANFTNLSQNQRMRGNFIYLLQENFTTKTCRVHVRI
jgi:CRISPR/Cas system-associated endonuclease Cas3-HD